MNLKHDYIAVFDSGVGGISVLRRLLEVLPNEKYLYFGDSINAPYGVRTEEEVRQLSLAAMEKMVARGIKAFVIACNTATSAAQAALQEAYPDIPVIGIEPAIAEGVRLFPNGHVGALATPGTLKGKRFLENKARLEGDCRITAIPAPGLMELVEAEKGDSPEAVALLTPLLTPHKDLNALALGCTHYPFAEKSVRAVLGDGVMLLDGAVITARQTKEILEAKGLLHQGPGEVIIENSLPGDRMITLSYKLLNQ